MKFETHLDRSIFQTIRGRDATRPQSLMGIIGGVDALERLVLTHDELSSGLQRLVNAGCVAENGLHRFYDTSKADGAHTFSGLSESDHARAVQEYQDWFRRQVANLDDEAAENEAAENEFVWRKLVLRWKTPQDRWPTDDDEDSAQALARLIDPIITQSGLGEINGFELGSGQIDMLIFGKPTDSDVDQVYELLAPTFRAFKCSAGSRIIRVYNERNEEIESDIVPDEET